MPRRRFEESQSQNIAASQRPSATRSQRNVKKEQVTQLLEQEEHQEEEHAADQDQGPVGRKRQKNISGSSSSSCQSQQANQDLELAGEDQDQQEDGDATAAAIPANPLLSQRSSDGFLPGSIRRISLSHFVTYDAFTIHANPYLNMIIGPNGSGKSTIACAIAIGLGFPPHVLGRAKDLSSFVKAQYDEGWVEIELQGLPGQPKIIIKRIIRVRDNSSEWTINGKAAKSAQVKEKVESLNIDVTNMCTFLPQDKVAEFASLKPQKRLLETQKAAGDSRMLARHEKLITLDKGEKELTRKLNDAESKKENLEQRNSMLKRDVQRFEAREQLEKEVQKLDIIIKLKTYEQEKAVYEELKKEKEDAKKKISTVKQQGQPIQRHKDSILAKIKELDEKMQKFKQEERKLERELHKGVEEHDRLGTQVEEKSSDISSSVKRDDSRKNSIRELRETIARLQKQVDSPPPQEDLAEINAQIRDISSEIRSAESEKDNMAVDKTDVSIESQSLTNARNEIQQRLAAMDDVKKQRLEMLRLKDPATYQTIMWLRDNARMFQKPVHEPIMLEIDVSDPSFVNGVESCIPWQTMKTFVCQARSDYDIFVREVLDKQKMRVTVAEVEGIALDHYQPPVALEKLKAYGFDQYLINVIRGPVDILTYLCSQAHLHTIPIAKSDSIAQPQHIEGLPGRPFKRFIIEDTNFTITWSFYGSRSAQVASRVLRPAQTLAITVDRTAKERLESELRKHSHQIKDLEAKTGALMKREAEIKKTIEELRERQNELNDVRKHKGGARQAWEKAKVDLNNRKRLLAQEEARPSIEKQRQDLVAARLRLVHKRADVAVKVKDTVIVMLRIRGEADVIQLSKMQEDVNYQHTRRLALQHDDLLREAETEYEDARQRLEVSKEIVKRAFDTAQACLDDLSEDDRASIGDDNDSSVEALKGELAAKRSDLESTRHTRGGVVTEYQDRKTEIEKLSTLVDELTRSRKKHLDKMVQTRAKWYPELKALVQRVSDKFSESFTKLGCAGEVMIEEAPEYEKWALQILVKFRDADDLQPLTGQRQSGGERSLTTIMYLMSLTELSRSPLNLVDEINQGMDRRSERSVHNHMVNVTCADNAAQYFLITPKLLTGLDYHEKMTVHIIFNGEWAPSEFDCGKHLQVAQKLKRSADDAA